VRLQHDCAAAHGALLFDVCALHGVIEFFHAVFFHVPVTEVIVVVIAHDVEEYISGLGECRGFFLIYLEDIFVTDFDIARCKFITVAIEQVGDDDT
jgi:hypothetical protein